VVVSGEALKVVTGFEALSHFLRQEDLKKMLEAFGVHRQTVENWRNNSGNRI
jgi:hypothetical protein